MASTEPRGTDKDKRHVLSRLKIPKVLHRHRSPEPTQEQPGRDVVLDFEENLRQQRLVEASQQLVSREEQLFCPSRAHAFQVKEADKLQEDFETLQVKLWLAVHETFSSSPSGQHVQALQRAAAAIKQQEEQDQRWQLAEGLQAPEWRPLKCLSTHNLFLQKMVESRLSKAGQSQASGSMDSLSTSVKREVCRMGKCLKDDLLTVGRTIMSCYPPEFDILNLYARLYQQAFSSRLAELAHSSLDVDDCTYLLFWVNQYYPNDILNHKDLMGHIKTASLQPGLLSEEDTSLLEHQYLTAKEDMVKTWMSKALQKEEESWLSGAKPEVMDQYCFCPLAIDVIQAVNSVMTEAKSILSNQQATERIMCQVDSFLICFRNKLEEFLRTEAENSQDVMKANLVCIEQFRDYVVRMDGSEDTRSRSVSTVTALRDWAYGLLVGATQGHLKVLFRQVWTPAWLTAGDGQVIGHILETLDKHLMQFTDLKPVCREELLGRLHEQVLVWYVRRMMKRKMRLRDEEQQNKAATLLCTDSSNIHNYCTGMGSQRHWLGVLLPKIAEVIRLQDPSIIQLEIVTLARDYPDLSAQHVSALLYLKSNLSASEVRDIKQSLEVNRPSLAAISATPTTTDPAPSHLFFSKVQVKTSILGIKPKALGQHV